VSARLLIVVNDAGFFLSHRLPVALAARDAGYDVHLATAWSPESGWLEAQGITHHVVPFDRSGMNPWRELKCVWVLAQLMRRTRPDIVHLVTPKAVLYGGIAARITGAAGVVAAISGLGVLFSPGERGHGFLRRLVLVAYGLALGSPNLRVIFQNPSDRQLLLSSCAIRPQQAFVLRGSGVDLDAYPCVQEPDGVPVVTMASRLLAPKGVREFVAAAASIKARGIAARFWLVGAPDPGNPASIAAREVDEWAAQGRIEALGHRRDVAEIFARSSIVVLPSYYGEGLPKVLIEAAACGRAVVTTDMPGCRDAIEPDVTGLLVPARDVAALERAIERLLADAELRARMGAAGRRLAEREFAIEDVVAAHLDVYRSLLAGPGAAARAMHR
jgi:glycosyltransferase involved in cell wall biosynthesis